MSNTRSGSCLFKLICFVSVSYFQYYFLHDSQVVEVEASKAVALREAELQKEVEIMNALTQTEKLKAEFLSKASVEYETKVCFIQILPHANNRRKNIYSK